MTTAVGAALVREVSRATRRRGSCGGYWSSASVALALVAGRLASCGGINEQRVGDDDLRFFVHGGGGGPSGGMDAEVVGVLEAADGCVLLELDGNRFSVVWPSGTSVFSTDPLVIELPSGEQLELGGRVSGGGGYLSAGSVGIEVPDECLNEYGEVAVFNRDDNLSRTPADRSRPLSSQSLTGRLTTSSQAVTRNDRSNVGQGTLRRPRR